MKAPEKLNAQSRFCIGLLIGVLAFFLLGAHRINTDIRHQQQVEEQVAGQVSAWHRQVAAELPIDQQTEWLSASQTHPVALLRACAIEVSVKR